MNPLLAKCDFLLIGITREEVEAQDVSQPVGLLKSLLEPDAAVKFCELVAVTVHGYDDDPRELWEIAEVTQFIRRLDLEFPYWLYFLSKRADSLAMILACLCGDPRKNPQEFSARIVQYLVNRGFPAMNDLCNSVGCSQAEIDRMTNRVSAYIQSGANKEET
jgi:hypothetical protein